MTDEFSFLPGDAARVGAGRVPNVSRVSTADNTVSALRYGDGRPEVTWLHGAGLNAHTFDPTIIATALPAVSIDLPGHGDSTWRDDADYRPSTIAPSIAAAIAEFAGQGNPQILVGHSLGGLSAAIVAAEHPERVTSLVMIDITPGITPASGSEAVREFIAGQPDFVDVEEIVDRAIRFGIGHDRDVLRRGVFLNTRQRPDGRVIFKHHLAKLASLGQSKGGTPLEAADPGYSPIWEALERISVPVTLVRATAGFVSEDDAEEFIRRVPTASVVTIESGHNVQEHAPVELAAVIRSLA
ncbi:alpha/beta fold hydrolase [Lysinibacter cavernae]|uniref:Pimeloyl-ACP methyl ester carboxylesterase n=1 Tax=Lysinibacter cavernae TaxID=1640652 RepID=A0A7X5R3F2_9MICO|nr:alpha/beta hydrolase [Lysinibacter cavernae]NIH54959.1 pimeloyl-ACP methyl ester carboxylesterase [Lysinibacter cavernae]